MMPPEQKRAIESYIAKMIDQRESQYAEMLDQAEAERDERLTLEESSALARKYDEAMTAKALAESSRDLFSAEVQRLEDWLTSHFPRQPRDKIGTVDAAIQILTLCHTYVPQLMRIVWSQMLQPAVQFFQRYGIELDAELIKAAQRSKEEG